MLAVCCCCISNRSKILNGAWSLVSLRSLTLATQQSQKWQVLHHQMMWLTQSFHPCDCLIQQVIYVDWLCTGALDLIIFYGSTIFMEFYELFSFTALARILLPHPIEEPIQLKVCAQLVQKLRSTADKLHHCTCVAMWLTGLQRRNMLTP